jgi:hypothetical protein
VHEAGAVRASQIFHDHVVSDVHSGVMARDGRVVDMNLVVRAPTNADDAASSQRKDPRLLAHIDDQLIGRG